MAPPPGDGRRLSLCENLLASGAAVVGATMVTHPIDVVKVRFQVADKGSARADSFSISRFVSYWPDLYRREGRTPFFSGIGAAACRAATYGAARIGLCDPLELWTGSRSGGAMLAGVLATVVGNPFEVLKVRLQAKPSETQSVPRALQAMIRDEGVQVLARGFHWAALRSALLTASQVVPYAKAKALLTGSGLQDGPLCHGLASAAAGVVTTTATAPVDVLKTRVMSKTSSGSFSSPMGMFAQEGIFVFFRGWLANYVRIGPQTLFIFLFYEQTKPLVRRLSS